MSTKKQVTQRHMKKIPKRRYPGTLSSIRLSLVIQKMIKTADKAITIRAANAQIAAADSFYLQIRERQHRYWACLEDGQNELPVKYMQAQVSLRVRSNRLQKQQSTSGAKKEISSDGIQKSPLRKAPPATLPKFLVRRQRGQCQIQGLLKYQSAACPEMTQLTEQADDYRHHGRKIIPRQLELQAKRLKIRSWKFGRISMRKSIEAHLWKRRPNTQTRVEYRRQKLQQ